jgi:hypothetical protein
MWFPFPISPKAQRCEGHVMMLRHGTKIEIKNPTRVLAVRWAGATCDRNNNVTTDQAKPEKRLDGVGLYRYRMPNDAFLKPFYPFPEATQALRSSAAKRLRQ